MRRIKAFLALVAVMVPMLIAFAGPAMADDNDLDCRNVSGPGIRCDHRLFLPANRFAFCDDDFLFDFNCGLPFRTFFPFERTGGIFFGIDQQIGDTGDVTLNTTVS